jgi:hypothetical protein
MASIDPDEKNKIHNILNKSHEELSTSKISRISGLNWQKTKRILKCLYYEKRIKWRKERNANLWSRINGEEEKTLPFTDISIDKKKIDMIPEKTIEATKSALKYIMSIVLIYIVASTAYLIYMQRGQFFNDVVIWSVGGFWAFFMGYWGWILAQSISQSFMKKIKKKK